jgi:hypothetical protein
MTYFVIVAVAAGLAAAAPAPGGGAGDTAPAVLGAPKMDFRIYRDAASCEEAIAGLTTPAGRRLICLPIERPTGEMASAY